MTTFDGNDRLLGGNGIDILKRAGGNDTLLGGDGADVFLFDNLGAAGVDLIGNAALGDRIRLSGQDITGISDGSGAAVVAGAVQVSSSGGVSTLWVGLDSTAGADLSIQLTGPFSAASFSIAGSDLILL